MSIDLIGSIALGWLATKSDVTSLKSQTRMAVLQTLQGKFD